MSRSNPVPPSTYTHPRRPARRSVEDRNAIVAANLGLAKAVVNRYFAWYPGQMDDCIQQAYLALMRAAELFDPTKGFAFSTYACRCILMELTRFVRSNTLVKIPEHAARERYRRGGQEAATENHCLSNQNWLDEVIAGDDGDRRESDQRLAREELDQIMAKAGLSPLLREAVELRLLGYTGAKAGELVGVKRGAMNERYLKAMRMMREAVGVRKS